jgi:uncharacterized protein YcgI (DUF1989 family)
VRGWAPAVFSFATEPEKLRTMPSQAGQVPGIVISSEVIPARAGWSRELSRGQVLRIVDLEGRQAVDFLCYDARDYEDRYAAADTMKINGSIFIRKGTVLYSVNCNPLFSVIEDSCGFHDTIGGCCSSALNRRRYGKPDDPNCRQNFLDQLGRYGMGPRDMPTSTSSCTCRSAPPARWTWGRAFPSPATTSTCAPRRTCSR